MYAARIAAFLVGLVSLATIETARAHQCALLGPEEHLRSVDLLAKGRIRDPEHGEGAYLKRFRLEISEILKGTAPEVVTVETHLLESQSREPGAVLALAARPDGLYDYFYCAQVYKTGLDTMPQSHAITLSRFRAEWKSLLQAVEAEPDDMDALFKLAHFLEVSGDRPGARLNYERMTALSPDDARGNAGLGRVLLSFRAFEEAVPALKRAVELAPLDGRTLGLLQRTQLRLGHIVDLSHVDFDGLKLEGLDLSGQDLRGRSFRRAELKNANFKGAVLDGAVFEDADLRGSDFSDASMRGVVLSGAYMPESVFYRTDLTGVRASSTNLSNARFSFARLTRFQGSGAKLDGASFQNTVLYSASLDDASMRGAKFSNVALNGVSFYQTKLYRSDFRGVDLSVARLLRASLNGARYDCTTRFPAKFDRKSQILVPTERLCGHRVQPLTFAGKVWEFYDFSGLDLRGADFRNAELNGARFRGSNLAGAKFSGSNLDGARFDGANLEGADFSDAKSMAWFPGANLRNADFSNAQSITDWHFGSNRKSEDEPSSAKPAAGVERSPVQGRLNRYERLPSVIRRYAGLHPCRSHRRQNLLWQDKLAYVRGQAA